MSRIRGTNTKPELIVRKYLFSKGFRYRLYDRRLPGKPDIVLKKYKTVIFVNGCFWHAHKNCRYFVLPKTRTDWWLNKLNKNSLHDEINAKVLLNNSWKVIFIWECDLKPAKVERTLEDLKNNLQLNARILSEILPGQVSTKSKETI